MTNLLSNIFPDTWPERILAVIYGILIFLFVRLPFLELLALTPLVTFLQRFSLTISLGSIEKTLQLIIFLAPFILYKAIREYIKRYSTNELVREPVMWIVSGLFALDLIFSLLSISPVQSLVQTAVKLVLYALFVSTSIWLKIIWNSQQKSNLLDSTFKIVRTFVIALGIFTIANSVISVSQFVDCSFFEKGCSVWSTVDNALPNRMLEVGHQKFNDENFLIRAPGVFGDVNLNGMVALFSLILFGTLLIVHLILTTKQGHREKRVIAILAGSIIAAAISYILTLSRSAVIGFLPVAFIVGIFLLFPLLRTTAITEKIRTRLSQYAIGAIVVIGFLLGMASQIQVYQPLYGDSIPLTQEVWNYVVKAVSPKDPSASDHVNLFNKGIELAGMRNYLGFGTGTFKTAYAQNIDRNDLDADPHSTYVTLLVEQGIIGLVVYIGFIGFAWSKAIQILNSTRKSVLSQIKESKTLTKEVYIRAMVSTFVAVVAFALPFFSIATITYYGFFLPFVWWFGSGGMIKMKE